MFVIVYNIDNTVKCYINIQLYLFKYEPKFLCCRTAILKQIFLLDEIFVYCDDTNISKISNLFEYLKTKFNFVLIITHYDQLKKYVNTELIIQKDCDSYICVK